MADLIWTPQALRDLARLHRFLASRNRDAARRAIRTIRRSLGVLRAHPEIGRPAEDMAPEFREWIIPFGAYGYIALYRYDGGAVVVLAIRHAREVGYQN